MTWQQVVIIALGFANGLAVTWLSILAKRVDKTVNPPPDDGRH